MKKITLSITLILTFFYVTFSFSQSSPKKGVTPPAYFWEFHQMIQSEYSNGYYAEKFRERKLKREQISQGLLPESTLAEDTVFALTLMGQYTNLSGNYTQAEFQSLLYDGPNPTGTVTEYYSEVSYNQLFFTGDAKGWYDMPRTLEEYEGGNSGLSPQGGPRFVWELMQVSDPTLNYADYIQYYDGQGRPHIGFLAVIHSGADASAGAFNIWAHRWDFTVFSGQPYTTDDIDPVSGQNVIIDGPYAIMSEISGSNNNSGPIATIGVFAHEFGHIFGVPDLYDTDGSSAGIGEWCLMASGSWGGNGSSPETPVHMSAWIKKELGWVTPINITSYQGPLSVPNAEENPIVYRMWQGGTITNQYFLIENRQRLGFDVNIHNSGFLIYHIDDNLSGNQNEDHYMVDVEQADGLRNLNNGQGRGDAGDPFPGSTQNTRFDFVTNPNSQDYSLQNTFVSVRNIYKDGNMMVGDLEVGPRSGAYAFGDPITTDFGTVEVGTNSNINTVVLTNFGDQDLEITDIPSSVGDFNLVTTLTFPITLSTYDDSLSLEFIFSPTAVGDAQEIFTVTSNDPGFVGFTLLGNGFVINPAFDRVMYSSSGAQNDGNILTINKKTGEGTNVGPSSFFDVLSLTISPRNNKLYAVRSNPFESQILVVDGLQGVSYGFPTFDLPNMVAIAFNTLGTLYGALETGEIYSIDLTDGTYEYVSTAQIEITAITFEPMTNDLWATVKGGFGSPKDKIYKIELATGDTTYVGQTGLNNATTNDLAFDENGVLYGIKGTGSQVSDLFTIDVITGEGTIIGSVGLQALTGLAYAETGIVNDVQDDENNNTIPTDFALSQNYPNPFNPSTSIEFSVPVDANVTLTIYNLLGQVITTLVNREISAGNYSVVWNGTDINGLQVSSGIYFYEMKTNGNNGTAYSQMKKMVFLK
ncbi:MAG: M6 family metalloprotease domain-containing protein [Bacteroidetes bacterium]|nr:M6 family metalloprotease domain-containing protein [Bacteroidota bacterium]